MNREQYDVLHKSILHQNELIVIQTEQITLLQTKIDRLMSATETLLQTVNDKTVIVSDVDEQFSKLKIEIDSLKDEQEA